MNILLEKINDFLNFKIIFSETTNIRIKHVLVLIIALWIAKKAIDKLSEMMNKKIKGIHKNKFNTVFNFSKWFLYIIIFLVTLNASGVELTALLTSAAALLIGVGLALQIWFQDIMSGIFIILDKSLQIGDIIEIDNKIGRVIEIRLRTTRMITTEQKIIIIPNHLYLTNSLYNWTKKGSQTRVNIKIGVAYGSDLELVKKLLIQAVDEHPNVVKKVKPIVLFEDFGDSALLFNLVFAIQNNMMPSIPLSEIRFKIDKLFREGNVQIPFPQRDIHIIEQKKYE